MKRFHKKIYFPENDKQSLIEFTEKVNDKYWRINAHSLELVIDELTFNNLEKLMLFIKSLTLDNKTIFEYYRSECGIEKICYRVNYSEVNDLILVVGKGKGLITVYFNEVNDNHITLKKELYVTN